MGADVFVSAVAYLARERTGSIRGERGIDDVRLVFAEFGEEAFNIIDQWYEGNPKMLFYPHTNSIDWETVPTVTSAGELVMVGNAERGSIFTDRHNDYCSQFKLVDPSNGYSYSLLEVLPKGTSYSEPGNQITKAQIDGNGIFEVRVDLIVEPEPDWLIIVWPRARKDPTGACTRRVAMSVVGIELAE